MCLYVAHSSTQTCRHALKAPTMHTKSALTLLLKLDIRLSGMKNLQEETDFFSSSLKNENVRALNENKSCRAEFIQI